MKSILIGLDAFDPQVFEELREKQELPHLAAFADQGSYRHLTISNPAQSEVSWTSLATGLNPGEHGLFDFVHRNPSNYQMLVSLLPTSKSIVGTQFVPPHQAKTFFDQAVEDGYPATSLWWPATFPAKQASPVASIPGLGTPDILGQLGVGSFLSESTDYEQAKYKSRLGTLKREGKQRLTGQLQGPGKMKGGQVEHVMTDFALDLSDAQEPILEIGKDRIVLKPGEWSPIFEVPFKLGRLSSMSGITRAIMPKADSSEIYFLPLQIHPLRSPWPYATPTSMIKQAWQETGPFLTLGWPQDTTSLDEGIIDDAQFLTLCEQIVASRERVFLQQLDQFEEGVLAIVFDTLDRVQHMFYGRDKSILAAWYKQIDALFGRLLKAIQERGHADARILVMSDHGFAPFDYKVHLNRWLVENQWMSTQSPDQQKNLNPVSWMDSKAYALGLNSLYLNLVGREGQGTIAQTDYEKFRAELKDNLLEWQGPDGRNILEQVWFREEVFEGAHSADAPDLVMGYATGYRASAETGVGGFGSRTIESNTDKWHADHCINPASVPGVLLTNFDLGDLAHPSYRDIPEMVLGRSFSGKGSQPREGLSDEDQKLIEERMKGLGYL